MVLFLTSRSTKEGLFILSCNFSSYLCTSVHEEPIYFVSLPFLFHSWYFILLPVGLPSFICGILHLCINILLTGVLYCHIGNRLLVCLISLLCILLSLFSTLLTLALFNWLAFCSAASILWAILIRIKDKSHFCVSSCFRPHTSLSLSLFQIVAKLAIQC